MFMFNNKEKQLEKQQKVKELIKLVAEYGAHRHTWNDDYWKKIEKQYGNEIDVEFKKKESEDRANELFGFICDRIKSL